MLRGGKEREEKGGEMQRLGWEWGMHKRLTLGIPATLDIELGEVVGGVPTSAFPRVDKYRRTGLIGLIGGGSEEGVRT